MEKKEEAKKVHLNVPQLLFWLVQASVTLCLWGRATGKTEGPGSLFTARNITKMPRGIHGIVSTTYDKVLNMVIPALVQGWEKLGYLENIHYWIRKYAPERLRIEKPYRAPSTAEHMIHWFNGAANRLLSVDRPSISNAQNLDSLYMDEVRFMKADRVRETILTVRGNASIFGNLPEHGSILMTTDLPKDPTGYFLFEWEKEMNREHVEKVMQIAAKVEILEQQLEDLGQKRGRKKIEKLIQYYNTALDTLRKELVYVSYASTLDNVHALGLRPIEQFKRSMSDFDFTISVLSRKVANIEKGYYQGFIEDEHGYYAINEPFVDSIERDSYAEAQAKDCRWDADLDVLAPIDIACDYNALINWVAIGQDKGQSYNLLNSMFVEAPQKIRHLAENLDRYYRFKKKFNSTIIYHYDHTAVSRNAKDDITYKDEWINCLSDLGWKVIPNYIGQALSHHSRFLLWQSHFDDTDTRTQQFRINLSNNEEMIIGMGNAGVINKSGTFFKDKSSEKDKNFPQSEATHSTEAMDTLITAKQRSKLINEPDFIDTFIQK